MNSILAPLTASELWQLYRRINRAYIDEAYWAFVDPAPWPDTDLRQSAVGFANELNVMRNSIRRYIGRKFPSYLGV